MKKNKVKYNPFKSSKLIICEYCGALIVKKSPNQKYCDINERPCKYYATLERNAKWKREKYKSKKQLLGSSNIGEHSQEDFEKEKQIVKKERRRLGI